MSVAFVAILEVEDPDGTRTKHPFQHPRVKVGRVRKGNDLALEDEAVSTHHCEFASEAGYFVVRDLGSANGTFVNRKRVGEARLRDGDEVRVGSTTIHVSLKGERRDPMPQRRSSAPIPIFVTIVVLAVIVASVVYQWRASSDAKLRARFADAVRDHVRVDPCAAPDALARIAAADAAFAGRSVALSMEKGVVKLSREDEKTDVELLALYRKKLEGYGAMLPALEAQQQAARESLERITRIGERFAGSRDRKMAFWAASQLKERVAAGDELIAQVSALAAETRKLCELLEAVVVRHEPPATLAQFHFSHDFQTALGACTEAAQRTSGAALTALNALDEE